MSPLWAPSPQSAEVRLADLETARVVVRRASLAYAIPPIAPEAPVSHPAYVHGEDLTARDHREPFTLVRAMGYVLAVGAPGAGLLWMLIHRL
jgi:hypothetical protein